MKRKVIVEVPHRISGFFEIVDNINGVKIESPEQIGSRGAGFNLNAIGRTEICTEDLDQDENSNCLISINGQEINKRAETTNFVFDTIKNLIKKPVKIRVNHYFDLPVGCGYGASGSGALGTVLGFDQILNLNLGGLERGRIAHVAEVVNRTGLGTICGQITGGLSILKEPGYPCKCEPINHPKDLLVICGTFGMIHTKSILTNPILNIKIKEAGRIALAKLIANPNIYTFMDASLRFVKDTNILEILDLKKVEEIINALNQLDIIGASMNQLGRSVFVICRREQETEVSEIFESFKPELKMYHSAINSQGPQIIKKNRR